MIRWPDNRAFRGRIVALTFTLVAGACAGPGLEENDTASDDAGDTAMWSTSQSGSSASSSGSATSVSTSESSSVTDGSSGFVWHDYSNECGTTCDIWNWGDCPDGQKCTAVACEVGSSAWDSNICVDIMGWKGVGDECQFFGEGLDGLDDCELGSMCWRPDPDTGLGTCIQFCFGSPSAAECNPGSQCAVTGDGVIPVCLPDCDPLAQDCHDGDVCIPNSSGTGFSCVLDASGGEADYGTPCQFANACNPGLLCVNAARVPEPACAGEVGCCSPMCNTEVFGDCPGEGQVCEPLFDEGLAPPGAEQVGVCGVPEGP